MLKQKWRILPKKRYAHHLFTNNMSLRLLSTHPCCTFGSIRLFALNNQVLNFLDIQMICCKIRKTAPGADILKTRKDVLQRMMTAIGERRGEGATVRETSQKEEVELWVGFPYDILKYTYPGPECSWGGSCSFRAVLGPSRRACNVFLVVIGDLGGGAGYGNPKSYQFPGGFQTFFCFLPLPGRSSNLTCSYCSTGVVKNHQLEYSRYTLPKTNKSPRKIGRLPQRKGEIVSPSPWLSGTNMLFLQSAFHLPLSYLRSWPPYPGCQWQMKVQLGIP